MKAYLLAAGLGTRLKPVTDKTPKCLIPVAGKPQLAWWIDLLGMHGITEILINTHHHPQQVRDFIAQCNAGINTFISTEKPLKLTEYYEQTLLGSGGTVLANKDFVKGEETFLICYADILTSANLTAMKRYHDSHSNVLTIALAPTNTPKQAGIAAIDENGLITEFEEKPANPKSNLANGGIYMARQEIFDSFPTSPPIDLAADVISKLTGRMYGWVADGYHLDIGTHENLKKAEKEWKGLNNI